METENKIRKLIKTKRDYLNLFAEAKELPGIRLFRNMYNFSQIQRLFLAYLYFYHNILGDIYEEKIDKYVLDNEIYEDAYMLWKRKRKKENKIDKSTNTKKPKDLYLVFDNKKKK